MVEQLDPKNEFEKVDLADQKIALIKAELVARLSKIIQRRGLSQTEAADIIGVDQPKISSLLNGKYEGYSIDRLIRFLQTLGIDVTLGWRSSDDKKAASDPTRWDGISDPALLSELMDKRFQEWAEAERYLRISSTPTDLEPDRVNTSDISLRTFVQFPFFGQREKGWYLGMAQGQREVFATALGIESRPLESAKIAVPLVTLTRSGHFEFCVPFYPWICFNQTEENYRSHPTLYPTAVVEFPVSFLQFVRELYRRLGYAGSFLARVEYRNLKGCRLYPGPPAGLAVPFLEGPQVFAGEHYGPFEQLLGANFDLDKAALKFAVDFYRRFGFEQIHVPYFSNGKFKLV
jgi:predicted XRE-type DNA-binding protein